MADLHGRRRRLASTASTCSASTRITTGATRSEFVDNWDLFYGIFKSVFFGATIAIVSCYRGFHCAPGAEGVGRAATAAFVMSFVMILILDFLLSIGLDSVHDMILARHDQRIDDRTATWSPPTSQIRRAAHRAARAERPVRPRSRCCATSTSRFPAARRWRSSARAAAARRCCSRRSLAWCGRREGYVVFDGQRLDELSDKELTAAADPLRLRVSERGAVRQHDRRRERRLSARAESQHAARARPATRSPATSPRSACPTASWTRSRPSSPAACGSASAWPGRWR